MTRIEHIGDATLYLGDCRDILPTLGKVDAVVTDPPYGIGFEYLNYEDTADNLAELIAVFVPWALDNADRLVVTPGNTNIWRYPPAAWYGCWTWDTTTARGKWGWSKWQPILFYGNDPAPGFENFNGVSRSDRIHFSGGQAKIDGGAGDIHTCPKPLEFMKRLLARCTMEGETILDPFMGSGTTGVACVNLGRAFIGIEREPSYFDIACRRIEEAYRQPRLFEEPAPKPVQQGLDLGPAHGIGPSTRLCEDLQRADGTRWNEAPKPGYNPLGKARDAD